LLKDSDSVQIAPRALLSCGVDRALDGVGDRDGRAGLVSEEIDRVCRVMPQQMIGPGARLTQGVDVGAPEEVGLHVQLLDRELATRDPLVDPLVRGIEAPRVPDHADETGASLQIGNRLRVAPVVRERDLYLHVLAGFETGDGLRGMQLCRGGKDRGFYLRQAQSLGQLRGHVSDAVLLRHGTRWLQRAADERDYLDVADGLDGIQMPGAESARSRENDFHGRFSRIR
jgi:hypothetical protein